MRTAVIYTAGVYPDSAKEETVQSWKGPFLPCSLAQTPCERCQFRAIHGNERWAWNLCSFLQKVSRKSIAKAGFLHQYVGFVTESSFEKTVFLKKFVFLPGLIEERCIATLLKSKITLETQPGSLSLRWCELLVPDSLLLTKFSLDSSHFCTSQSCQAQKGITSSQPPVSSQEHRIVPEDAWWLWWHRETNVPLKVSGRAPTHQPCFPLMRTSSPWYPPSPLRVFFFFTVFHF